MHVALLMQLVFNSVICIKTSPMLMGETLLWTSPLIDISDIEETQKTRFLFQQLHNHNRNKILRHTHIPLLYRIK